MDLDRIQNCPQFQTEIVHTLQSVQKSNTGNTKAVI